jgi:Mn-dependent DtxR family transcriptional regulator
MPDIARMTNHTQEACDGYIKAYKKVEKLSKTMKNEEIAQILGMRKSLVEEYIRILNRE